MSPRYEIFKNRAIFNFLNNQRSRISLFSQPFSDGFFRVTSHLKEQIKLYQMGHFLGIKHDINRLKNFKNTKWKNWVWGFSIKIAVLKFLSHQFYKPILQRQQFSTRRTTVGILKRWRTCCKMQNSTVTTSNVLVLGDLKQKKSFLSKIHVIFGISTKNWVEGHMFH